MSLSEVCLRRTTGRTLCFEVNLLISGNYRRNFVLDWEPGSAPHKQAWGLSLVPWVNQTRDDAN
jgi:hypothetical protein